MKSLWPEGFEENSLKSAKNFFDEQAKFLSKITGGIVFAEVVELSGPAAIMASKSGQSDFSYGFYIIGKYIGDYRFKVLTFSHDITLYPVYIRLDGEIASELGIGDVFFEKEISSPEDMESFIESVLKTKRISNIIGSIMRLSK